MYRFSHIKKINSFKKLEKDILAQIAFAQLGSSLDLTQQTENTCERFCCSIYGKQDFRSTNEVRLDIFGKKYGSSKCTSTKGILNVAKGIDAGRYPPCSKVLEMKTRRANYVTYMWKQSLSQYIPSEMNPDGHGWRLTDEKYEVVWFDGAMSPQSLEDIFEDDSSIGDDDEVYDSAEDDSDESDEDED